MAGVPILKIYRDWKDKRPERPIFRTILVSMLAVLLVEIVLMSLLYPCGCLHLWC